jgi:hypothetical protein
MRLPSNYPVAPDGACRPPTILELIPWKKAMLAREGGLDQRTVPYGVVPTQDRIGSHSPFRGL